MNEKKSQPCRKKNKWVSFSLRKSLHAKIETVSKAQEISVGEFLRRLAVSELRRLGISVDEEELFVARKYNTAEIPGGYLSVRQKRAMRRREKLIENMKKEFKSLPPDLQDFYKIGEPTDSVQ